MRSEHDSLDKLWDAFITEKDYERSISLFNAFSTALLMHMHLEDEVLEPIINQYLGVDVDMGPAAIAHRDHSGLVKLLEKIDYALKKEPERLEYETTHFRRALSSHHAREVDIHYPLFDRHITTNDWSIIRERWVIA